MKSRRLIIGDIHGCATELENLLMAFGYKAGVDRLLTTGDVVGKGPLPLATLELLAGYDARMVLGNHEAATLRAAGKEPKERTRWEEAYLRALDPARDRWLAVIARWPLFLEFYDLIMVHAGLDPRGTRPEDTAPNILLNIRTWDGCGDDMKNEANPAWFDSLPPPAGKTVVFGHWAKRGLVDLPGFKGLDTGCVYGKRLTGWCPEENVFVSVPAQRDYVAISAPKSGSALPN